MLQCSYHIFANHMFKIHNFLLSGLIFMFWFYQYMLIWLWGFTEEQIRKGISGRQPRATCKNISAHIYIPEKYSADLFLTKEGIGESPEMIYPQKTPTGEISRSLSNPRNVIALLQVVNPPTMGVKTDCPCLSSPQWPASKNYLNTQHLAGRLTHHFISVGDWKTCTHDMK